jgi:hypothetical protein
MIMLSVVAPAVFSVVGQAQGGQIMRRLFPYYYAASVAIPLLAMAMTLPGAMRRRGGVVGLLTLGLAFGTASWNAFVVRPRLGALRMAVHAQTGAADPALAEAFGRLHVQSVTLLSCLMILAVLYVGIQILAGPGASPRQ